MVVHDNDVHMMVAKIDTVLLVGPPVGEYALQSVAYSVDAIISARCDHSLIHFVVYTIWITL